MKNRFRFKTLTKKLIRNNLTPKYTFSVDYAVEQLKDNFPGNVKS